MQRIAIIGNAGGGKSALARKLGNALNISVYQFDDLQWQPGWTRTPEKEIHNAHSKWLAEPKWIIDGWGSWDILDKRFLAADTIIFVDFHIAVHYWWAAKRQLKAVLNLNSGWPPEGCHALPVTGRLIKLIWKIHKEIRPQLVELIYQHASEAQIVHLKSPREMKEYLHKLDDETIIES
jgi:hypothetical protein